MNKGALEFSESKFGNSECNKAIDLMQWISDSFEDGYMLYKLPHQTYFVGHSKVLFSGVVVLENNKYPVYKIVESDCGFYTKLTYKTFHVDE